MKKGRYGIVFLPSSVHLFDFMLYFVVLILTTFGIFSCKEETPSTPLDSSSQDTLPQGYTVYHSELFSFWLDTIASGMEQPWGIAFLSDEKLLVTEKEGALYMIDLRLGERTTVQRVPASKTLSQGGLLDVAIDPDFAQNSYIYLTYSKEISAGVYTTALAKAKLEGTMLTEMKDLLITNAANGNGHHFGSRIAFLEDKIFFSVGDRGEMEEAQDLASHQGKIIRLHLDGTVPNDNPFVNTSGAAPEVWSYGHRNVQGLTVFNGALYAHEHGPMGGDELNLIKKGVNYGWPAITFGIDYDGTIISTDTAQSGMEQPITYWVPSIAPCGLAVNTSEKYEGWKNHFFIGGLASMALWRVEVENNQYQKQEKLLSDIGRVRTVAISPSGYIYFATERPGIICRIVPIKNK